MEQLDLFSYSLKEEITDKIINKPAGNKVDFYRNNNTEKLTIEKRYENTWLFDDTTGKVNCAAFHVDEQMEEIIKRIDRWMNNLEFWETRQ